MYTDRTEQRPMTNPGLAESKVHAFSQQAISKSLWLVHLAQFPTQIDTGKVEQINYALCVY